MSKNIITHQQHHQHYQHHQEHDQHDHHDHHPADDIERHAVDGQASGTNGMIKLANEVYAQTTVSIGQPDFALDEVKNA